MGSLTDTTGLARRDAQQGNVVIITLIIVVSLTALALGVNLLMRTRVDQEFQLRSIGDAPKQARYAAEIGINQFLFNLNNTTLGFDIWRCFNWGPCQSGTFAWPANGNFPPITFVVPPSTLGLNASYTMQYAISVVNPANPPGNPPPSVIAQVTLQGPLMNYQRTVAVDLQQFTDFDGATRWQVAPNSWRESS